MVFQSQKLIEQLIQTTKIFVNIPKVQLITKLANYRYYRQYGKDEYKMFTDDEMEEYQANHRNKMMRTPHLLFERQMQQIRFHSNFQSGNLEQVYTRKNHPNQYYLVLSNDTNTKGFNQWFYFKAMNTSLKIQNVKFIIVNCNKKIAGFLNSIGVSYFSLRDYQLSGDGWKKTNNWLSFNSDNNLHRQDKEEYHSLEFQYQFKLQEAVYFSLTLPYTFTKLKSLIDEFPMKFQKIGSTFCGNPLYVYETGTESKKIILITARQHPSETSSSFVAEGIIRKLEKPSNLMNLLKKKYKIILIPMVNPDGVIHGNSRTNLLGYDINRKWEPIPERDNSHQIYCIYNRYLKNLTNIEYLIDLHGHSKKLNCFGYFSMRKNLAAMIAYELSEKLPYFSMKDCQLNKSIPLNTLRDFAGNQLNISKVITMETSIYGWSSENTIKPFCPKQMFEIGSCLIGTIGKIELQRKSPMQLLKQVNFGEDYESSDSDPEGDYLIQKKQPNIESLNNQPVKRQRKFKKKIRIKTLTNNFYKPTLTSAIRERIKTQFIVDTLDSPGLYPNKQPNSFYRRPVRLLKAESSIDSCSKKNKSQQISNLNRKTSDNFHSKGKILMKRGKKI